MLQLLCHEARAALMLATSQSLADDLLYKAASQCTIKHTDSVAVPVAHRLYVTYVATSTTSSTDITMHCTAAHCAPCPAVGSNLMLAGLKASLKGASQHLGTLCGYAGNI